MRRAIVVTMLVVLLFAAVSLLGCSAADKAVNQAVPNPKTTADPAKRVVCLTNEQVFETQVGQYAAANPGSPLPSSLDELKAQGIVDKVPNCPNGGTYTWDPTAVTITCSVDGHWK
jgi:competence protein ComGC